jgi:hypothetical protein
VASRANDHDFTLLSQEPQKVGAICQVLDSDKQWCGAIVIAANGNGTYDVQFHDGRKGGNVKAYQVKDPKHHIVVPLPSLDRPKARASILPVGCKVEAVYQSQGEFIVGRVAYRHNDKSYDACGRYVYDVWFDDGRYEERCRHVRLPAPKPLQMGDVVDVLDSCEQWHGGVVVDCDEHGRFGVQCHNGSNLHSLRASSIKDAGYKIALPLPSLFCPNDSKHGILPIGSRVEADYGLLGTLVKGCISYYHQEEHSYDVWFDDCRYERNCKNVKVLEPCPVYNVGAIIDFVAREYEAHGAMVTAVNADGTYQIERHDGERSVDVDLSLSKSAGYQVPIPLRSCECPLDTPAILPMGCRIQAAYQSEGELLEGRIAHYHETDSTYDVWFADGRYQRSCKEFHVLYPKQQQVLLVLGAVVNVLDHDTHSRTLHQSGQNELHRQNLELAKLLTHARGAIVTAVIGKCVAYDIQYHDGSTAANIEASHIRSAGYHVMFPLPTRYCPKVPSKNWPLPIGGKIEARHQSQGQYARGRISHYHPSDQSYDVLFDDSRYERSCKDIRLLTVGSSVV